MDASSIITPAGAVRVQRTFAAPIEKAFQAWVDPKKMAQWFARGPKMPMVKVTQADGKQGGMYRIECEDKGITYRGWGTYRELKPPEKLVFTWAWEHHDFGDSLIT